MPDEVVVQVGPAVHPAPRVSVIIPAWRAEWLNLALDSVRTQTFTGWELLVIDDGSPEPVQPERVDDLVLIRQPNTGPGGARNRGIAHARGELLAFLDSDDQWLPAKLERQVAFHDAHPTVVVSSTDLLTLGHTERAPRLRRHGHVTGLLPFADLFLENCLATSAVIARADAVRRTIGMDPQRRFAEDYALWLRLGLLGDVGFVNEPLVLYRVEPTGLTAVARRTAAVDANEIEVKREFLAEHTELAGAPWVKPGLARAWFDWGYALLAQRAWGAAARAFLHAALLRPQRPKAWLNVLRAILHVPPRAE